MVALIKSFEEKRMDRNSIHDAIEATYTTFERDGRRFVQIDSYGRAQREIPGKKSQSIQLDEKSARELFDILGDFFRFRGLIELTSLPSFVFGPACPVKGAASTLALLRQA